MAVRESGQQAIDEARGDGGVVLRALYAWSRPAPPTLWSSMSGLSLGLHPPLRGWGCPAQRWALFERDVEAQPTGGPSEGCKLRHPFFLAELPARRAYQLMMLSCDASAQPPRFTFAGGVVADLDDGVATLRLGERQLQTAAWPDDRLCELAGLPVLPLPFGSRPAAQATLADGRQLWVDESCLEYGPDAVELRLGSGNEHTAVVAEAASWTPGGALLEVRCSLGRLKIAQPPHPATSFWLPPLGLPLGLARLTVARAPPRRRLPNGS